MTEPENFDDDLFADLYNDDEPSAKPVASAEKAAPPSLPAATPNDVYDGMDHAQDYGAPTDSHQNEEYDEDDDDVDFNLGNGNTAHQADTPSYNNNSAPAPAPVARGPNSKEDGKMFIGGLNWETTDQSLREYFSQFGEVIECTVMRDGSTGRSRGFGFLTFKDPKTVNVVMVKEHHLDGKIIDPKRAIPRDEQEKTSKIFVGGVSQDTTDQEFRDYFAQFGRVIDSTLMMDKDTGRPRGFGFVTFESEAGVEACLATSLEIHGKPIEVKKAQPRGNMREEEEANRRGGGGKFRKGAASNSGMDDQGSAAQQMGGTAGMTPQMMAQYWQRMQQYFTMMQQQQQMMRGGMGMGGMAGGMNPAMMQMMQMQQQMQQQQMMAAQGRGAAAGANPMMADMNPQMMQQMQAMMAQQQQGAAAGPGGVGPQGGGNRAGYGGMDQQMFDEPNKFDNQQQVGRRGGSQQPYNQQQAYGMGGGGGAPTSWEGMYDDVPQPNPNQGGRGGFGRRGGGHHHQQQQQNPSDPNNAPPANAPTGPKNAGRPGANYRGGGRGGNRGYHPYARG